MVDRGRRRAFLILTGVIGIGLIVLFRYWDIPIAAVETGAASEAYRQAGLPWVAKDLDPVPPVPEAENAAPILLKAIAQISPNADDVFRKHFPVGANEIAKAKVALSYYRGALSLAHTAAFRPRLDFHRDWALGPSLVFPEASRLRKLVLALDARAELELSEGHGAAAASDLRDAMRIASLCGTEPYPYCLDRVMKWEDATTTVIELGIASAKGNTAEIRLLREAADSALVPKLEPALLGQSFDGLTMYRNFKFIGPSFENSETEINMPADEIVRNGLPSGLNARAYATRHMQGWTDLKRAMDRLGNDPIAISTVQDEISTRYYNHVGRSYRLSAIAFPVFGELAKKLVDLKARLAAIRRG